jgi:hypothetical protein
MAFRRVAPQVFENSDGYTVQVGSRTTIQYIEEARKAIIEVEFGVRSICIYYNRIEGWISGNRPLPMTTDEKRIVVERVAAALRFNGSLVEMSSH